jgi:hypothetical protein
MDILAQLAEPPSPQTGFKPLSANKWDLHTALISKVKFTRLHANAILQYILTIDLILTRITQLSAELALSHTPQRITEMLDIVIGRHTAICAHIRALLDLPHYPKVGKNFTHLEGVLEELVGFSTMLTLVHDVDRVKEEEILEGMMRFYGEKFGPMVQRFKADFQGTLRDLEVWEAPRE